MQRKIGVDNCADIINQILPFLPLYLLPNPGLYHLLRTLASQHLAIYVINPVAVDVHYL